MKAEKYIIMIEAPLKADDGAIATPVTKTRFGFGAAGEEVQKLLAAGMERIRVRIDGTTSETVFGNTRPWRLLDIKQRIKGLSADDD